MRIRVNGEWVQIQAQTVAEVLHHYNLGSKTVVVEVNGSIADREQWATTAVTDGMILEIVHFVSGG